MGAKLIMVLFHLLGGSGYVTRSRNRGFTAFEDYSWWNDDYCIFLGNTSCHQVRVEPCYENLAFEERAKGHLGSCCKFEPYPKDTRNQSMEIPIYSFEGTMELCEWFQWLEEYFDYANIQNEWDKTLTSALHLTGQAYTWVRRKYEYWTPDFPWDTFKNFKKELEFEEKWNYKERKALELEYYNNIEEEAWGVEDDEL
eukprot:Gb_06571 [translate_table: standard]